MLSGADSLADLIRTPEKQELEPTLVPHNLYQRLVTALSQGRVEFSSGGGLM